ncbi:hypothetical protein AC249_AIPGENE19195, partial [Exaiptasia diaphana]
MVSPYWSNSLCIINKFYNKYIPYCIFIPTCSSCNNHKHTEAKGVNWRCGNQLQAYCGSKVIFVEISQATAARKGGGKGVGPKTTSKATAPRKPGDGKGVDPKKTSKATAKAGCRK